MMRRLLVRCSEGLPVVLLVAVWQGLLSAGVVDAEFLPAPMAVARALADLLRTPSFYVDVGTTIARSLAGLAVGAAVGLPVGACMAISRRCESFFGPLVKATYALPKTALVPLFILWFGIGSTTNISAVVVSTVLPVVVYTYHGVAGTPDALVWSARAMGTRERDMLRLVRLPAASHEILTGVRIALGFSFVVAIAAEMIAAQVGAGKLIFMFGENGAYAYMFAATLAVVVLAYGADAGLLALASHVLRWRDADARQI